MGEKGVNVGEKPLNRQVGMASGAPKGGCPDRGGAIQPS